jgi:outer membrane protein assembly factor BamB
MRDCVFIALVFASLASAENWPQFRGPGGEGHSKEANLPLNWSESQGVKWKVPLPGKGWSSPIIVDNEIWLTTATEQDRSLRVLTIDATNGRIRNDVEVFHLADAVAGHAKNSGASPSVIVDGDRVYVHFGSYGTACLKRDGSIVWRNQELKYSQVHGPGGSPVLYENLLIVNCDGTDTQFVAALDTNTGKVVWRKPRPSAMAYATPLVVRAPGGAQLVSPGAFRAVSYEPRSGNELWSVKYGDGFSNVPRPVYAHGLVYLCTGFYQPQVLAVRPDGKGDVTASHITWRQARSVPLTPSPIVVGDEFYMVSDNGIVSCLDAKTGKENWRQRFSGNFSASPVYAEDKIYFLSETGETTVIAPGKEFRKLATNQLEGSFLASMGVSLGAFFLRSDTHLYRIQK